MRASWGLVEDVRLGFRVEGLGLSYRQGIVAEQTSDFNTFCIRSTTLNSQP